MSLFDLFRRKSTARKPICDRKPRLRLEELERREVPTNDILTVAGPTGQQVSVHFQLLAHNTVLWNEVGVYAVDDAQGRLGDLLPGDAGYAAEAMSKGQTVFRAGDLKGETTDLSFTAGTHLAYYLVQNNTLENVSQSNPNNLPRFGNQVFFSLDILNRDHFDHLRPVTYGDRSVRLQWEDAFGGGDRDFDDNIVKVSFDSQGTSQAIGFEGQSVPTRFRKISANSAFRSEFGWFEVDDASGAIGSLTPGEDGYAQAAIERAHRVFRPRALPGAVRNTFLPGEGFFGLYLIPNGNSTSFLLSNPENSLKKPGPLAFFSIEAANPDGFNHIRWLSATKFAFEDGRNGGDRDFDDFVGKIVMAKPFNTAPFVRTAIPNKTVAETAANESIDLAGTFGDLDLGNSIVRIATNKGTFDLELFDRDAPRTVANFLNYVTDGDFANAIFHRRAQSPSVLQGGGFEFSNNGNTTTLPAIPGDPPVANEPDFTNRSNVRGTIAMAKSSANDATSQFFFNVGDNSTALNNPSNSGGFTVFGRVVEGQMHIVDQLAAIPTSNKGSPFNEIPLDNYTGNNFPSDAQRDDFIVINSITVLRRPEFLSFGVVANSNPSVVNVSLIHNHATLDYLAAGTSTIVFSATDSVGHITTTQFTVNVTDDDITPPVITLSGSQGTENDGQNQTFSWSASDAGSGLASTSVTIKKDGNIINTSSNASGTFDFNSFGLGVYEMTVTATDADNDSPGDSLTSTATRTVTVTDDDTVAPVIALSGSQGAENDGQDQSFTWNVTDADAGVGSVTVTITQNGNTIHSSTAASGTFNFNSFGTGDFVMTVSATDADNDWSGDSMTSNDNRTVTVTDDDTVAPTIILAGSQGSETDAQDQTFSWDVTDAGAGVGPVTVTITQDGNTIQSSTTATGTFDFNSFGPGVFAMTISATDADNDWVGDALTSNDNRSVTVTDDDTAPPVITLGGSQGTETTADPHQFTWDVTDAGSGLASVTVTVAQDGTPIFTSSDAANTYDFSGAVAGTYEITVSATDADNDFASDSLSNSASRSVIVV
jgi:cyclophilin family peptidyl-prolyl cis-trans isomerase